MRILYLSCHSILEFDEIKLLHDLGHYVFSPGAYVEPRNPGDASMRPGLESIKYDQEDVDLWHEQPSDNNNDRKCTITSQFVKRFDAVIVMHIPDWINQNWANLNHRPVIWRTIGQSITPVERSLRNFRMDGMKIVRYSPRETSIPGYIGEDAMIRFYKDSDEFSGWTGRLKRVLTVNQAIRTRHQACNYVLWETVTKPFTRALIGPGNENIDGWIGKTSFDDMKTAMRDHRAYFYVGTHPASYTLNFIEAWMTGIPMVAIGPEFGNAAYFPGHNLYEVPDFIENGVNGFVSDNAEEMQANIKELLNNEELGRKVSAAGRASAIKLFGRETIAQQWKQFLETI